MVVYPIIYKVLAPSQVVQDFLHQQYLLIWIIFPKFGVKKNKNFFNYHLEKESLKQMCSP